MCRSVWGENMTEDFMVKPKVHGRPASNEGCTETEMGCYDFLDGLGIPYDRVDHDVADTIAACHDVEQVLQTPICKNLFLCNRQKTNFYLLLMEGDKVFKTKDLSKQLGCARLSFADREDMERYLHVTPGSVSVLGLLYDTDKAVQLVLDKPIAESQFIGCHPCKNTSTLAFSTEDLLKKILPALGYTPTVVMLPDEQETVQG